MITRATCVFAQRRLPQSLVPDGEKSHQVIDRAERIYIG
jgi:hypothetical protein